MNELEDRMEALLERQAARARVSPDAWERIEERLGGAGAAPSRRRGPTARLVPAVASLAAVALVLALGVQWLPTTPGVEIEPLDPDTEQAEEDAVPDRDDRARDFAWQRVEAIEGPASESLWVNDLFTDDRLGLVVAGGGLLWRSSDEGQSWQRVTDAVFDTAHAQAYDLRAVTRVDDTYVIAGGTHDQGLVWHSEDGHDWERTEVAGAGLLYDLVAEDGQLVAVGRSPAGAAALISDDAGRSWERAEVEAARDGNENGMFVLAHGPAGWVATGYGAGDSGHATIWTSHDARTWDLATDSGVTGDGVIDAIAADDDGYLAVRADGSVLSSADGRRWDTETHLAADDGPGTLRFGGLARVEGGWLAVGGAPEPHRPPRAYTSDDGRHWEDVAIDDRGDVHALTLGSDGTAIAAGHGGGCDPQETCTEGRRLALWRGAAGTGD